VIFLDATEIVSDPSTFTVEQLKKVLTKAHIPIPQTGKLNKAGYVALYKKEILQEQ